MGALAPKRVDLLGEVEVLLGQPAGAVRRQHEAHGSPPDVHVRVVVSRLGGVGHLPYEFDGGRERRALDAARDGVAFAGPRRMARQPLVQPSVIQQRSHGASDPLWDNALVPTSDEWFDRARRVTPGGVNSPVRAFGAVGGNPRFMVRGDGAYLYDPDGNDYVDLVCSWGPTILGHAHPA